MFLGLHTNESVVEIVDFFISLLAELSFRH